MFYSTVKNPVLLILQIALQIILNLGFQILFIINVIIIILFFDLCNDLHLLYLYFDIEVNIINNE